MVFAHTVVSFIINSRFILHNGKFNKKQARFVRLLFTCFYVLRMSCYCWKAKAKIEMKWSDNVLFVQKHELCYNYGYSTFCYAGVVQSNGHPGNSEEDLVTSALTQIANRASLELGNLAGTTITSAWYHYGDRNIYCDRQKWVELCQNDSPTSEQIRLYKIHSVSTFVL